MIEERIRKFNSDRNWEQFHTPENLSKSIILEAAELLENFQWDNNYDIKKVTEELADVLIYCYQLAITLDLEVKEIMKEKMDLNEMKYPIDKSKGSSKKYNSEDQ